MLAASDIYLGSRIWGSRVSGYGFWIWLRELSFGGLESGGLESGGLESGGLESWASEFGVRYVSSREVVYDLAAYLCVLPT